MKSGIYIIINIKSNKIYAGQSKDAKQRIRKHKEMLKRNVHYSKYLQEDWNKYGESMFSFEVVEKIESYNKQEMLLKESEWINWYKNNTNNDIYNISPGMNKMSEETKKILSHKSSINNPRYWLGKKRSKETILKVSNSLKGKYIGEKHPMFGKEGACKGKKITKEHKKKISDSLKGHSTSNESRKKMSYAKIGKPNKSHPSYFEATPEVLEDIKNGISQKDFVKKYGRSINTLKRIKNELKGKRRIRVKNIEA